MTTSRRSGPPMHRREIQGDVAYWVPRMSFRSSFEFFEHLLGGGDIDQAALKAFLDVKTTEEEGA